MNEMEEELFREYERQLDEHHKSLPLWDRSRPEAIYAVMTIPDAVFLVRMMMPALPAMTDGLAQVLKGQEEGVIQALQWLKSDGCTVAHSIDDNDLIEQAHDFSIYASNYVDIADFYVMCGRGLARASVDKASRTITFDTMEGPGQSNALAWHEHIHSQSNRGMELARKTKPEDADHARRLLSAIDYVLADGRIHLGEFPSDLVEHVQGLCRTTQEAELLPLPPETDMLGFTMFEFRAFMKAVTAWSHAAFIRYVSCVRDGVPQSECMPTQVVPAQECVNRISALSQLSAGVTNTILDRLTFRPGPKANILLTPFLRGEDIICWSPAIIMKCRHERNLLKIMARGAKVMQNHSATVNGSRDRLLGRLVGEVFSKRGYQFKLDTPVAANGESTNVDVLLYQTKRPDEVLIIEAKALIAPDEINEVHDATQTLLHAQDQVRRAKRILAATPDAEKRDKFKCVNWSRVTRIYGVVVSSDAEPHALIDLQEIPALTYGSLRCRFQSRDFRCPSRFWEACVQRPWLDSEITGGEYGHSDVRVGNLTYRVPVCALSSPT